MLEWKTRLKMMITAWVYKESADTNIEINCDPPKRDEIIRAIKKMKNGKAAGPDGIPAEALKTDVETTANMLLSLFEKIWEEKKYHQTGKMATSSNCQRRETSAAVRTTEASHSPRHQGKCSIGSCWIG
jgi:hypothetical protein